MSALGMVLEDAGLPELRASSADLSAASGSQTDAPSHAPYTTDETLLPPLPESGQLSDAHRPSLGGLSSAGSSTPADLTPSASMPGPPLPGENIYFVPQLYALDSLALSIDTPPIAFPSVEAQAPVLAPPLGTPSLPPAPAPPSTSPLRRLKSLKNGIRKLSFSRVASLTQTATPPLDLSPPVSRPLHLPSHSELLLLQDTALLGSAGDSMRLVFSACATPSSAGGNVPQGHTHTSSVGLGGSGSKPRRRTASAAGSLAAATTPLPLPVVTLSVDLSSTKKNMASVEQSFFDNWGAGGADTASQALAATPHDADPDVPDKLAILSTPEDLMEYLVYLSLHKKSVELAYEVSKNRLVSSGWCSGHDIENLNLQRDSSLSQIDSKLLQIEARLNSEFNMSFLNSKHMQQASPTQKCAPRAVMSPSLKDLENKCLYFYAEQGDNMCQ